ncbi:hypothetical protein [Specibacter cremeus]|uniref:hypothetical protein n=1 Tax=Specibacter cremeus TaxID=1629051 RepID=UPI000F7A1B27|nr:hypothetical protein [Specibacter cremeus]
MMGYAAGGPSAGEVARVAGVLDRLAGQMDEARVRLAAAGAVEWESAAAQAFREAVAGQAHALAAAADDLRGAAGLVRHYSLRLDVAGAAG